MIEHTGTVRVRPAGGMVAISLAVDGGPVAAMLSPAQAVTIAKSLIECAQAISGDEEAKAIEERAAAKAKADKLREQADALEGIQP